MTAQATEAPEPAPPAPGSRRRASYEPSLENRGLESELARLEAQCSLSWSVEVRRLDWLGLRDGQRLLEVGCGPGFFAERLQARYPRSGVVGLDVDGNLLAAASRRFAATGSPVRLVNASATATGLAAAWADVAVIRYVFQHLEDPIAAAVEVRRVLRPGGLCIVIDIDDGLWGLVEPSFPELAAIYARAGAAQRRRGGDRNVGRRLGRILDAAGYADVHLDAFSYDSHELGLEPFLPQLSPDRLLPLLDEGALDGRDLALAYALLDRFLSSPSPFVLMTGFIASGRRPTSG